jgi:peptidoglycan-associated lipoprotein
MRISRQLSVIAMAALCTFGAACAKKKVAQTPPPPPPPAEDRRPVAQPERTADVTPARRAEEAKPAARSDYPDAKTRARIEELLARIQDAYFDYDKHTLRADAVQTLQADAKELGDIVRQYPAFKMRVEGYCDERGSAEYNIALGDRRAVSAKEYLTAMGVPNDQMSVKSMGKEQQVCNEHDEACWQKNRRVHIVAMNQ